MSEKKNVQTESTDLGIKDNPLVFMSHDTRDAEIAEAFSKLLSSVSAGVLKSFRSSDNKGNQGIEYGVEWYPKIIDALNGASDVVCLLTENSINRPWILFEAGMAKGKLNTPILGVALGVSLAEISSGPFAQFQNCADDENSLTKLVKQLVNKIPNSEPDEDVIRIQVQQFKLKIEKIIKENKSKKSQVAIQNQSSDVDASAKLFEEVKIMFKELPSRIERVSMIRQPVRERGRRLHPMFIEEVMRVGGKGNRRIALQIILAPFKIDMPWVYEGALDCLMNISKTKSIEIIENEISSFMRVFEFSVHHPLMREQFLENEYNYKYVQSEVFQLVHEILRGSVSEARRISHRKIEEE